MNELEIFKNWNSKHFPYQIELHVKPFISGLLNYKIYLFKKDSEQEGDIDWEDMPKTLLCSKVDKDFIQCLNKINKFLNYGETNS